MGGIEIDENMWKDILDDCDDNNDGKVSLIDIELASYFRSQRTNLVICC